ncbi:S-layer homology domain-containing protein [Collinsella tanakaei]|uniref:S-layer homology domain-containing protein n=1 Tax=Collinsella tanakaei TaxID=626935 RepID=UPI00195E197B|nr:S-layer homology domain-containing protein [Collinsella tanakaei]MBM6755129.1 S-layer homology domain-containing protein [Collinsella tanakaei]
MMHTVGFWKERTRSLILRGACALGVATAALGVMAQPALGLDVDGELAAKTNDAYNFSANADTIRLQTAEDVLPSAYDLRDLGVVTPVKFQNPWGTCWGFGAIAASETSILSERGETYADTGLDLSERHLAYFTSNHIPVGSDNYDNQGGEGGYNALTETDALLDPVTAEDHLGYPLENATYNRTGYSTYATSLFSSGIGPVLESDAPYKNDEGIVDKSGVFWSDQGIWSLAESLRGTSVAALEESYILPSPATLSSDGTSYTYNELATTAMKEQILAGRALAVSFHGDQSMPGQASENAYINPETWAHYTYEPAVPNHMVTIVGWDDSYSKENFNAEHQPPADGAWIVKNSWGSADGEFPNKFAWGDNGYFYLSYYDQSIVTVEAFDFDVTGRETDLNGQYIVNQYDYLPTEQANALHYDGEASAANVFTAAEPQDLTSLSCETSTPQTKVTYEVYRLADDAADPTDGELALTLEETYEFGGYHLVTIPEADRAKLHFDEGERFSVVVTMQGPDGYYILAQAAFNEAYRDRVISQLEQQEESTHALRSQLVNQLETEYREQNPDATDEDVDSYLATKEEWLATATHDAIQLQVPGYFKGVVNAGESFMMVSGEWSDWSDMTEGTSEALGGVIDIDNPSIKAYAVPADGPYSDVPADAWYHDAVIRATELGIMGGYGDGVFGPEHELTREQAAMVLWNALGEGATDAPAADLPDVAQGEWYSNAVNWAVEGKLINGYDGSDKFGVGDPLTREQFARIIANAAGADLSEQDTSVLDGYVDGDAVTDWARPAVVWAVETGVIGGVEGEDGTLTLDAVRDVTRAEMAKMILNAIDAGVLAKG